MVKIEFLFYLLFEERFLWTMIVLSLWYKWENMVFDSLIGVLYFTGFSKYTFLGLILIRIVNSV